MREFTFSLSGDCHISGVSRRYPSMWIVLIFFDAIYKSANYYVINPYAITIYIDIFQVIFIIATS